MSYEDRARVRFKKFFTKQGPDDCWPWEGAINSCGYGSFGFRGSAMGAHRVAYFFEYGSFPPDATDHLCRNRRCVNPAHLEAVTTRENVLRGEGVAAQQAKKTHCKRGHPITGPDADLINQKRRARNCRICFNLLEGQRKSAMTPEQKEARRLYMKEWRAEHRDQVRAQSRAWKAKNRG